MPEVLGKYRLLKRLAVGGMAEIWLARQESAHGFEKLLVVKRILPHLAEHPEFVQMFLDEARLAAQLNHQNIAQIFDLGEESGTYFIAMEHIHGENLRVVARRLAEKGDGRLEAKFAARVISQSAEALHYAHIRKDLGGEPLNIVHRDVSPQNIILGYDGVAKVVDFGIAKAASQFAETRTGILKGKYAYMSPEQTLGKTLDGRSDVFALGVVFWELITGHRLYSRNSDLLILKAISEEPPPPPRKLVPDLDPVLEAIIMKALAKEPDDRFASAAELHETLEDYLHQGGERITSKQLAEKMGELFPDRLKAWEKLFASAQAIEIDLDSPVFEERSDLLEMGTPSASKRSNPRGRAGTGESSPGSGSLPGPIAITPDLDPAVGTEDQTRLKADRSVETSPPLPALSDTAERQGLAGGGVVGWGKRNPLLAGGLGLGLVLTLGLVATLGGGGQSTTEPLADPVAGRPDIQLPVSLQLRTTPPGATVKVNGVALSSPSPISTQLDPTGEKVVVLIEKEGFQPEERRAVLDSGARLAWEILLRAEPGATPAEGDGAKTPEAEPEPAVAAAPAAAPPPRPAARRREGYLSLDARPWCRLSVDGKDQGVTPFARLALPAGKRRISCVHPSLGKRSFSLRLRPGKEVKKILTLGEGKLKVLVKPWAVVFLDGKKLGETPFPPVKVDAGEHTVLLVNDPLKVRKKKKITVAPGRTVTLEENLAGGG